MTLPRAVLWSVRSKSLAEIDSRENGIGRIGNMNIENSLEEAEYKWDRTMGQ